MPRFAAIDMGSNALRLRIVEASGPSLDAPRAQLPLLAHLADGRDAAWREIVSLRSPVRLGAEVFQTGKLPPSSIGHACSALKEFRQEMDAAHVDVYRATATSAVREASNGSTLVERARREAGIELDVIEGVEEARLIQLAVTRRLPVHEHHALLVDVGGGSTELTVLDGGKNTFSISLPVGTVRLIEAYLKGFPTVDRGRAELIREAIDRALGEARPRLSKEVKRGRDTFDVLIGTGGNIETLAELCPTTAPGYPKERAVDMAAVRVLFGRLTQMTAAERIKAYDLRADRADTIVPAAAIFLRLSEVFGIDVIVAPGVGLKEGILEELVDKHFHVWDSAGEERSVLEGCVRLGHRYGFDEAHGRLVADLAARLFDGLTDLHRYGDRERLLLRAAATLHDIGDFVRYDGHHKHSFYLIQHADLMGLRPDERAIVANVARYHRKSVPDPSHPNFRELDKEARGKVRALAGILRIADALDREHLGKVQDVQVSVDRGRSRLLVRITGDSERELEEWTVQAKAGLFRDVFGLDVVLTDATHGRAGNSLTP